MYERLGELVSRHWIWVILGWIALGVGLHLLAPRWDDVTNDGDLAYLPARMTSVRGERRLAEAFPNQKSKSQIVLICARIGRRLTRQDRGLVERLANRFRRKRDPALPIDDVWSPATQIIGPKLISRDHQCRLVVLLIRNEFMATRNIAALAHVRRTLDEARREPDFPSGLLIEVSGSAAIGGDMLASAQESIKNTELTTVLLVLLILLVVYRAPLLATIPLATIGLSVTVAMDLVALLTQAGQVAWLSWIDFKIFTTSRIFIIVILFGAGTDFCLFLIARYKEELELRAAPARAVELALARVGDALVGSAMTTICGLATLYFADFGKYKHSGPAIALCLAVALAACLTLAPALLRAFGKLVFWPRKLDLNAMRAVPCDRTGTALRGLWPTIGRAVLRWPGPILVASIVLLAPLAWRGTQVEISYDLLSELEANRPSVRGTRLLRRHFAAGETGAVTVVASHASGLATVDEAGAFQTSTFDSPAGRREVALLTRDLSEITHYEVQLDLPQYSPHARQLAQELAKLSQLELAQRIPQLLQRTKTTASRPSPATFHKDPRTRELTLRGGVHLSAASLVTSVRSIAEPLGGPPGLANVLSPAGRRKLAALRHPRTKALFLSQVEAWRGRVTRLDIVLAHDPFSKQAILALDQIDQQLQHLARDRKSPWFGTEFDLVGTTAGTRDLMAVTQADLVLIQRLVLIAVLAVLIVILRRPLICLYLIVSVVFSYLVTLGATELLFSRIYRPFDGLDWKVPLFLFVILIAIGEDYNIYLTTRILEEQRRWGKREGLRVALVRTGGIITSCGVIMAGTFISMMTGTLRGMLELGFALSLGVMLDTVIVRPVLVPSFLALLYGRDRAGAKDAPVATESQGQRPDELVEEPLARRN